MEPWELCCKDMTGYSANVVRELSRRIEIDPKVTFVTLLLFHVNVTYKQLAWIVQPTTGRVLEESTLRKIWVARCLAANDKAASLADLERRFSVTDKDFADCFSIVDGVPVYCRGERDLYNKKQGCKYLTFQWYIMFDGCPLAVTGPYPGSMHDSEAVRGSNPFPHKSLEWILADLAYIGMRHMLTQKKGSLGVDDEWYDMEFRRVRNRIERVFGGLDNHRFLWYSLFGQEVIAQAVRLIFNAECIRWELEPPGPEQRYGSDIIYMQPTNPIVQAWTKSEECDCTFFKEDKEFTLKHTAKQDAITTQLSTKRVALPSGKRSPNSKGGPNQTYLRRTKKEMKQHKADMADLHKSDKAADRAIRKGDNLRQLAEWKRENTPLSEIMRPVGKRSNTPGASQVKRRKPNEN